MITEDIHTVYSEYTVFYPPHEFVTSQSNLSSNNCVGLQPKTNTVYLQDLDVLLMCKSTREDWMTDLPLFKKIKPSSFSCPYISTVILPVLPLITVLIVAWCIFLSSVDPNPEGRLIISTGKFPDSLPNSTKSTELFLSIVAYVVGQLLEKSLNDSERLLHTLGSNPKMYE